MFTAAAANRLNELRAATRLYLAWCSIVEDHLGLDLTAHQKKQAESKVAETSQQVDSLIAQTFTQVLTPSQDAGTSTINWQTTKATATGDVGARVSKKLATEEKLIVTYWRCPGEDGHRPLRPLVRTARHFRGCCVEHLRPLPQHGPRLHRSGPWQALLAIGPRT